MGDVIQLYDSLEVPKSNLQRDNNDSHLQTIYKIVATLDNYSNKENTYLKIQVIGTSKLFIKTVAELYDEYWLKKFSKEDVAYIGFLYASILNENTNNIQAFPLKKQKITRNVIILALFLVSFLMIANVSAIKMVGFPIHVPAWFQSERIFHFIFPAGLLFFPMTYFFEATITEVYGFRVSRLLIWVGFICNSFLVLSLWITAYFPASPEWLLNNQDVNTAYSLISKGSLRIFVASSCSYLLGELLSSFVLAKLKILTSGSWFILRYTGGLIVGVSADTIIFCHLAFVKVFPLITLSKIILLCIIFKFVYLLLLFPVIYYLTKLLKKVDAVDYYDFKTKFNPFSLKL